MSLDDIRAMRRFGMVQPDVLDGTCPLSANAKLIYACMTIFAGAQRDGVRPSVTRLAKMASLSESSSRRALKELESAGLAVAVVKGRRDASGSMLPTVWRLRDTDADMEGTLTEDGWVGWSELETPGVSETGALVSEGHHPSRQADTTPGVTATDNHDQAQQYQVTRTRDHSHEGKLARGIASAEEAKEQGRSAELTTWTNWDLNKVLARYKELAIASGHDFLASNMEIVWGFLYPIGESDPTVGVKAVDHLFAKSAAPHSPKAVETYVTRAMDRAFAGLPMELGKKKAEIAAEPRKHLAVVKETPAPAPAPEKSDEAVRARIAELEAQLGIA